jgi:hypothetical protein
VSATGQKVYLEFTYRRPRFLSSTLVAVHAIVLGFTASNCIVFGEYLLFALGKAPAENPVQVRIVAVTLMTSVTVLHGCFLRTGIMVQNILGWIKIGVVIFMTLASGAVVVGLCNKPGEIHSTTVFGAQRFPFTWGGIWEGSIWNWGVISTALFKVFYSYAGLQNVNNVLNEVRNPVKTLRSAAPAALGTACLLYLLINLAYFLVVPLDEIKESGELVAALFFERVFGQALGRLLLPLAVAVSAAGNVSVVTFALVGSPQPTTHCPRTHCSPRGGPGAPEPRDCTPKPDSVWTGALIQSPVRSSNGWLVITLRPVHHRHLHTLPQHIFVYLERGGLPWPALLPRHLAGFASVAVGAPRTCTPLSCIPACRLVHDFCVFRTSMLSLHSTTGRGLESPSFQSELCPRGHLGVSDPGAFANPADLLLPS